jgi:hypothetical protein
MIRAIPILEKSLLCIVPPLFAECKGPKTKSPQCIPHDYKRTAIPCQGYFSTYYNRRLCQLDRPAYLALLVLRGHKRRTRSPESRKSTVWSRAGSRLQRKPPRGMVSRNTLEIATAMKATKVTTSGRNVPFPARQNVVSFGRRSGRGWGGNRRLRPCRSSQERRKWLPWKRF